MNRVPVTLIFDIGKTTKKVLIFDQSFHVLEEKTTTFPEITDDDGFPAEDLSSVSDWFLESFHHYTSHSAYQITHCNVSAYGASFVHLDKDGKRIDPFFNYLKSFPEPCHADFQSRYDTDHHLDADTASPFLGLLNSGLQLFWLKKEKPTLFQQIKTSLHLPQYFCYLLSGKTFTDITSVGCHTMLWDFQKNNYHHWVGNEKVRSFFPELQRADYTFDLNVSGQVIKTGIGVHDSSAALMPYLATQHEQFLLLSTGTWNICFNPFNNDALTPTELKKDCLCYLTYQGKPVKASRIFLGHEHELQEKALAKFFDVGSEHFKRVTYRDEVYQTLSRSNNKPFYPVGMEGTGPLPDKPLQQTDFSAFRNFEEAYHQLVRYLVRWQLLSINLVDPDKNIKNIIVVGGFTKNPLFLEILKREDTDRKILISDHPRASALGAAWLVANPEVHSKNAGLLSVSEI